MAVPTDIFSVKIITEFQGVQMSNKTFWQLDAIGDDPTIEQFLFDFLSEYALTVSAITSSLWKVVCGVFDNISNPEGTHISFATFPGLSANTGHPQFQVFRINRYARSVSGTEMKHGSFSQSGVEEAQSVRGRVQDVGEFAALRQFLHISDIMGTGWTIQPFMRWNTIAPATPPIYQYIPIRHAQVSPQVHVLRSRKSILCATA